MRWRPLASLAVSATFTLAVASAMGFTVQSSDSGKTPHLLTHEAIQADLGLSEKQKGQIVSSQSALDAKRRDLLQGVQNGAGDPEEMKALLASAERDYRSSLLRVLDKNQKARLTQIELQREGFYAVTRSEIASKLKLTPAQNKKVKVILDEMRQEQATSYAALVKEAQEKANPKDPSASPSETNAMAKTDPAAPAKAKSKKRTTVRRRPPTSGNTDGFQQEVGLGQDQDDGSGAYTMGYFALADGSGNLGLSPSIPAEWMQNESLVEPARIQELVGKGREKARNRIAELLTDEQKAAFEKLTGKPFDFSSLSSKEPTASGKSAEPNPSATGGDSPAAPAPAEKKSGRTRDRRSD